MQSRVTIDPKDIIAIDYECQGCGSFYSVKIEKISHAQMSCPTCGARWVRGSYDGTSREPKDSTIVEFARALQQLKSVVYDATIRLEVAVPLPVPPIIDRLSPSL